MLLVTLLTFGFHFQGSARYVGHLGIDRYQCDYPGMGSFAPPGPKHILGDFNLRLDPRFGGFINGRRCSHHG